MILIDISNKCQLDCTYCYAKHGSIPEPTDDFLPAILRTGDSTFVFHGREPLCEPELLLKTAGFIRRNVKNAHIGVQTNAVALSGRLAEQIAELDLEVGISIDGPYPYNMLRGDRESTERVTENLENFLGISRNVGLICVLTTANTPFPEAIFPWAMRMFDLGVRGFRFNPVVGKPHLRATDDALIRFYEKMFKLPKPFSPVAEMLAPQRYHTSCAWRDCDPHCSIIPILLPDGQMTSCLKNAPLFKWSPPVGMRSQLLQSLSYEDGGCAGCRWWGRCKGGCPEESSDPYLRSEYCKVWQFLFAQTSQADVWFADPGPCQIGAHLARTA